MTDPQDSYHAHQKKRQVYVVMRVDEGDAPLAERVTVVTILKSYQAAEREVERLSALGKGTHMWQVGWLEGDA